MHNLMVVSRGTTGGPTRIGTLVVLQRDEIGELNLEYFEVLSFLLFSRACIFPPWFLRVSFIYLLHVLVLLVFDVIF
jgi:hypothetical protein